MRSVWIVAAALAAVVAGCGSTTPSQPIGFNEPSAVAVFRGLTPKYAEIHPYVAVVNAGRSDLTILDAWDDSPVLAPVVVRSLAVPVPVVRPAMLVSSSLADGTDADPTPDLLVVASPGCEPTAASSCSSVLRLVSTWDPSPHVVDDATHTVDLGTVAPGANVLALAAVPALDPVSGVRVPGQARVVASLTGGRLAIVDYHRTADAKGLAIASVLDANQQPVIALQPLVAGAVPARFDAVSLAVNAALPAHLYAASPDPIGGVEGVADLTMSGAPGAWTIEAFDARAPTTVVAAARLRERADNSAADDATAFPPDTVDRVYAVLDPARCGPADRVPCGIAVLDPLTHAMLTDYTTGVPMPYLAPIQVPGVPLALSISLPPKNPPSTDEAKYAGTLMKIAPPSGVRGTTAVAAVASSDGRVYFVDLGRWSIPNTSSILRTSTRTMASSAGAIAVSTSPRQLGLWQTSATGQDVLLKTGMEAAVTVTPGFTTSETWTVSYQGTLPGLELHRGDTGRAADGATWVALQVAAPRPVDLGGGQTFTQVVKVTDPSLGIHVGDIVRILAMNMGVPACDDPTSIDAGGPAAAEATIADILPPSDDAYPGGALTLAPLTDVRFKPADETHPQIGYDWPACIAALANGTKGAQVEIRASDFVVVGSLSGYAGRPVVRYAAPGLPSFSFAYADEDHDPGVSACTDADPAACTDASCRPACEKLALVRKARRIYHVSDACSVNDVSDECNRLWPGSQFPRQHGPVIAFSLGYVPDPADNGTVPTDPKLRPLLREGLKLTITTVSGISPTAFRPGTGSGSSSSYPLAATTFDRSVVPGKEGEGYRFYVPFVDAFMLDFSPSQAPTAAKILR